MSPQINALLQQIRSSLAESEEAWGPEDGQATDDDSTLSSKAGDGGATNITAVKDSFDMYITNLVSGLQMLFDMDDGQAMSAIEHVASEMAADNMLMPMPADSASDAELSRWAGAAYTAGLGAAVMQFARDHAKS